MSDWHEASSQRGLSEVYASTIWVVLRYGSGSAGELVATRTLTVVFTDLSNYTASVGRSDREAIRHLIAKHEQTVIPVVEACGGRIVKNLGDSYMALFEAASDAAQACLELVTTINADHGFSIRAAMATGDVETIDGDAFGEAVNLAARILSKAPRGEVWLSSTTRMCMNQTEVAWEHVGGFTLKGMPGHVPIYRLVPQNRVWLVPALVQAIQSHRLVRVSQDAPAPSMLPKGAVVLLEGFEPGSAELTRAIALLPVVEPANLWFQAYSMAPSDRYEWTEQGRGIVMGTSEALSVAIDKILSVIQKTPTTETIILEFNAESVVDLVLCGMALPSVPIGDVVAGYSYDMLNDGRWTNRSERAVLRAEVSATGVRAVACVNGIIIGGQRLQAGDSRELNDGVVIQTLAGKVSYIHLNFAGYFGALVAWTSARMGLAEGESLEIGREPNHPGLALPDRRGQENIRWCVGARAAHARDGGFTLDRALAGRRQMVVSSDGAGLSVKGLHKTINTHVLRDGSLFEVQDSAPVQIGDMIVAGTSVVALRAPKS
jgi:class 3 adenylate cyclase